MSYCLIPLGSHFQDDGVNQPWNGSESTQTEQNENRTQQSTQPLSQKESSIPVTPNPSDVFFRSGAGLPIRNPLHAFQRQNSGRFQTSRTGSPLPTNEATQEAQNPTGDVQSLIDHHSHSSHFGPQNVSDDEPRIGPTVSRESGFTEQNGKDISVVFFPTNREL